MSGDVLGNAALHESGASPTARRPGRRADRHLFARHDTLRIAVSRAGLRRPNSPGTSATNRTTRTAVSLRRVCIAIPRELETIVRKANRRGFDSALRMRLRNWPTTCAASWNIVRFWQSRPRSAIGRPNGPRRHRTIVTAGAVMLCLAVAALSVSTVLISRERAAAVRQQHIAQKQRETAEQNLKVAREAVHQLLTRDRRDAFEGPRLPHDALLRDALDLPLESLQAKSNVTAVPSRSGVGIRPRRTQQRASRTRFPRRSGLSRSHRNLRGNWNPKTRSAPTRVLSSSTAGRLWRRCCGRANEHPRLPTQPGPPASKFRIRVILQPGLLNDAKPERVY